MPSLPFEYTDFTAGLNTRESPYVEDTTKLWARSCQNVVSNTNGSLIKATGRTNLTVTLGAGPTSLASYEDGTLPRLLASDGPNVWKIAPDGTVTSLGTGFTTGSRWTIIQTQSTGGRGPVYLMNGIDTPQTWDGTSSFLSNWTATTGAVPNGQYMILAGNRLWVAGMGLRAVSQASSEVIFSDLIPANAGPITWPTSNLDVFDENDGTPITGLGKVGAFILVTKARKLYMITDMNTGDARRLSDTIGCVAHRTIADSPLGTFFLSADRGVYLTNGSKLTPISDQLQPTFDAIQDKSGSAGIYYNGHYYLSIDTTGNGVNDTLLDYDTVLGSWWKHTTGFAQMVAWTGTGSLSGAGQLGLYGANTVTGSIQQLFVPGLYTNNGSPITWQWQGAWQSPTFYRRRRFPTSWYRKNFRQLRIEGSGTVDVSVAADFQAGAVLKQSDVFNGLSPSVNQARVHSLGVHKALSPVFGATSSTLDQVNSYTWMITDRRDGVVG